MSASDAATASKAKATITRPEKPDEEKYKTELAKAEKELAQAQEHLNSLKTKVDNAQPKNKDSPAGKRKTELISELNEIREKQKGSKSNRNAVHEKIKKLDEQLKSRQNELKTARGRLNFKSSDDIDREIERLQKQVDTGAMKLVDERKALTEISNLNKAKKNFTGFDAQQKQIDQIKAQIAEQKKLLDDPEQKALSERYNTLQAEVDKIKAEQDEAFKNLNALRDERTKASGVQNEKWTALKKLKDDYYQSKRAFKEYEDAAWKARKERQRAEREAYENEKRRKVAEQKLEEASAPAYQDEILTAEGLIRYFDPSAIASKVESGPGKFAATAQRTVDDSGIKGTRLVKKEEDYFIGTGGKKGKKGKKNAPAAATTAAAAAEPSTPTEAKFNLSLGVLEELSKVKVEAPASQADVPNVVAKLKERVEFWKADQKKKTEENIAKAKKEIERLEAEGADDRAKDAATKPSQKNQGVNGQASAEAELKQEQDAEADVAEELKKASIEDSKQPDAPVTA